MDTFERDVIAATTALRAMSRLYSAQKIPTVWFTNPADWSNFCTMVRSTVLAGVPISDRSGNLRGLTIDGVHFMPRFRPAPEQILLQSNVWVDIDNDELGVLKAIRFSDMSEWHAATGWTK